MKNSCSTSTVVSTTHSMPALPGLYKNRSWDHSQSAISGWSRTFTSNKHAEKENRRLKQSQKWAKRKEAETESKNIRKIYKNMREFVDCREPGKNTRYWLLWNLAWTNHLADTRRSAMDLITCAICEVYKTVLRQTPTGSVETGKSPQCLDIISRRSSGQWSEGERRGFTTQARTHGRTHTHTHNHQRLYWLNQSLPKMEDQHLETTSTALNISGV